LWDWKYSFIVLAKECFYNLFSISTKCKRQEIFDLMKTHHLYGKILTPSNKESTIIGPWNTDYILRVKVTIFLVKNQRREHLLSDWWRFKDLKLLSNSDSKETRIRRKSKSSHWSLEIEMSYYYSFIEINYQSKAININCN
jgi:hypothetical protein